MAPPKKKKKTAKKGPGPKKTAKKAKKEVGPKKSSSNLTTSQKVDVLLDKINKTFKHARCSRGKDYSLPWYTLRRPTGLVTLDVACAGGLPAGGIVQIIGKPSVGKTYLLNRILAQVQMYYGDEFAAAVAMTEGRYGKDWAKECGVRTSLSAKEIFELEYVEKLHNPDFPGFTPEEVAEFTDQVGAGVTEIIGNTAEDLYDAVLAAHESQLFQVIAIDSLGSMLTKNEDDGDMADKSYGGASQVNTQFMHKLSAQMCSLSEEGDANPTTIILINQYRMHIPKPGGGGGFGRRRQEPDMKQGGGYAVQHGKMLDIEIETAGQIWSEEINKKTGKKDILGKKMNWEILKQKAGGHEGHRGFYKHLFASKGASVCDDLTTAGLMYDLIQMSGAWFNLIGDTGNVVLKGQGREKFVAKLEDYPEFQEYIHDEVMKANGIKCRYGPIPEAQ